MARASRTSSSTTHKGAVQRYWFKQKRYGYGAAPATWEGWAVTAAYVAVVVAIGGWFAEGEPRAESRLIPFLALTAVVTIFFVALAWRKTEGGWRWRWGKD